MQPFRRLPTVSRDADVDRPVEPAGPIGRSEEETSGIGAGRTDVSATIERPDGMRSLPASCRVIHEPLSLKKFTMTQDLHDAVDTIIASLPKTERDRVDRQAVSDFVRRRRESGQTTLSVVILAGLQFVRTLPQMTSAHVGDDNRQNPTD